MQPFVCRFIQATTGDGPHRERASSPSSDDLELDHVTPTARYRPKRWREPSGGILWLPIQLDIGMCNYLVMRGEALKAPLRLSIGYKTSRPLTTSFRHEWHVCFDADLNCDQALINSPLVHGQFQLSRSVLSRVRKNKPKQKHSERRILTLSGFCWQSRRQNSLLPD